MKPIRHQEYLDEIQALLNCDRTVALFLAICGWYQNKGYDVKHDEALLKALKKNGVYGNLWLYEELYEKDPSLFLSLSKIKEIKKKRI